MPSRSFRDRLHPSLRLALETRYLRYLLPTTDWGDRLFALAQFYEHHRRLPRASGGGLNDALFHIKTGKQIVDPLRVFVTDKEFVKRYVASKVGEEFNIPTIAVLRSPREARSFDYPDTCFIKPTHMSGEVIYRRTGEAIALERIQGWFNRNYYYVGRERNYRTLTPKVIVEPVVFDNPSPTDYKIFCVDGRPAVAYVLSRYADGKETYYTRDWQLLPFGMGTPAGEPREKPANWDEMLRVASAVSRGFNLVRVDLYSNGRDLVVGELTNCHGNARVRFFPASGEAEFARIAFGRQGASKRRFYL